MSGGYNNRPKKTHSNKKENRKKAQTTQARKFVKKQKESDEMKAQINAFVRRHKSGEGYKRLGGINELLIKYPQLHKFLIDEIHRYVVKKYHYADRIKLCSNGDLKKILKNISLKDFSEKKYEKYPYLLKSDDFYRLMSCQKSKILVRGFKNSAVYQFKNNYIKPFTSANKPFVNSYVDNQFFASKDNRLLFGKTVRVCFKAYDANEFVSKFSQDNFEYDSQSSLRGLSVAMYGFLQGKENCLSLFARLDDDGFKHRNLLIDEQRKAVFGEIAGFPHFHFQNYTDQYLCRKEGKDGYMTGRCNAIDIPSLLVYLEKLDSMPKAKLRHLYVEKQNLGLPFLDIRFERKDFSINLEQLVKDFIKKEDENKNLCKDYMKEFLKNDGLKEPMQKLSYFKSFALSLMLLQKISDDYWSENDLVRKRFLSRFEVALCDKIMDMVCNVGNRICRDKNNKPYYIENDFDEKYVNFPAL